MRGVDGRIKVGVLLFGIPAGRIVPMAQRAEEADVQLEQLAARLRRSGAC